MFDLHEYSKPRLSLADYTEEKMSEFRPLINELGLTHIDLQSVQNNFSLIKGELENMKEGIPINLKLLYTLFLEKLDYHYQDYKIKSYIDFNVNLDYTYTEFE